VNCLQSSKLDSEIDKFLVFAHHKNLLDAVERACNQKGAHYIRIDGQLATNKRQKLVNDFQDDASCRVAILSIKAAGVGLTLTAASHVIFAELYWIPGTCNAIFICIWQNAAFLF
jgi:SWI/SNF-related matrix-associated actin-dependent regulator of chromatin subfamily A-like protein 1